MKIVHICMAQYSNGWTYQENLLAKYHKRLGYDVSVLTSMFHYDEGKLVEDKDLRFVDVNGVNVVRLRKKSDGFLKKMPIYDGFYQTLQELNPDVIFSHGCQYVDVVELVRFIKTHQGVQLYVDNHADYSNSATNFFSREILHKIIWRYYAQKLVPYTNKFWGVMPSRVDFLRDVYKIPEEKIDLLVMGADDDYVEMSMVQSNIEALKESLGIKKDDFVIVTGGKIDSAKKQTLLLMEAVSLMRNENIVLVVFGPISDDIKSDAEQWVDDKLVKYVGWVSPERSYDYFAIADLVVFPGRHSVFWEQAAGQGKPMIVKDWEGTHHIDINGNVLFLRKDSKEEITKQIISLLHNRDIYEKMRNNAEEAKKYFSYRSIALRSIEM